MNFHGLETEADKEVFRTLYELEGQKLYHIAQKILHNETDAEDAVHAGFLRLADRFGEYRHLSYENMVKLVSVIVKNTARDITREYGRKGEFNEEDGFGEESVMSSAPDVLEELIARYEQELLTEALQELTEKERELLMLQYGIGLKPKEIAEIFGVTSAIVRKKMLKCRKKLAGILEKGEYREVFHYQYLTD